MTLAHADARSWAEARSSAETPRLGMLEAVAFQSHPEVVATFGEDGKSIAALLIRQRATNKGRTTGGMLLFLGLLAVLSPVVGMAVLGAGTYLIDRVPAPTSVPIAAGAFAVAVVMLAVALVMWMRSGAFWSGMLCGIGVVAVLSAGFSAISMPNVSARDGYALPALALVPVWLTLALGLVLVVALLLRFRVRVADAREPARAAVLTVGDRAAAATAAAALSPQERAAIKTDRDAALQVLGDRSLIDSEMLERALRADLGTLFTLDSPRGASA